MLPDSGCLRQANDRFWRAGTTNAPETRFLLCQSLSVFQCSNTGRMAQMKNKPFAVVEFAESDELFVSVVSALWLSEANTKCAWPIGLGSHQKLINHSGPEDHWLQYSCKVLKFCETLAKAKSNAKEARTKNKLESSEIETTPIPKKRSALKRRAAAKLLLNKKTRQVSDSEEDILSSSIHSSDDEIVVPIGTLTSNAKADSPTSDLFGVLQHNLQDEEIEQTFTADVSQTSTLTTPSSHAPPDLPSNSSEIVLEVGNLQNSNVFEIDPGVLDLNAIVNGIIAENQKFESEILGKLVNLEGHVLELLRRTATPGEDLTSEEDPDLLNLPVDSLIDFDLFNNWLKTGTNKSKVIHKVRFLGGRSPNDTVCRILAQLLSTKLAKETSLTGKEKCAKRGIHSSPLQELLYESVRLNKHCAELTDCEIDGYTKKWLKNSKDRDGGRERRSKSCFPIVQPNELSADGD